MVITHSTHIAICSLACCVIACAPETYGQGRVVATKCATGDLHAHYFNGALSTAPSDGAGPAHGFAEALKGMGESPLSCETSTSEAYRIVVAPYRGGTFAINAQRSDGAYHVTAVLYKRDDRNAPDRISQAIGAEQFARLREELNAFDFWSRAPHIGPGTTPTHVAGAHGAAWILEAKEGPWYHAISRVSGSKERQFDLIAKRFFELMGLEPPAEIVFP